MPFQQDRDTCAQLPWVTFLPAILGLGLILLPAKSFHFHGTRKEDVVFKVDVLMQVLLEFPQTVVERVKGGAGILWSSEVPAKAVDFSNQGTRSIVLLCHHRDRIGDRPEATVRFGGSK